MLGFGTFLHVIQKVHSSYVKMSVLLWVLQTSYRKLLFFLFVNDVSGAGQDND